MSEPYLHTLEILPTFVRYVIIEVPSIYSCDPEIDLSLSTFDGDDQLLTRSLWVCPSQRAQNSEHDILILIFISVKIHRQEL